MSLSALVCDADYGAIGTIVKLDKSYYYLKVEKYVFNKLEFDTLKIQKFTEWSCGRRHEEYEIGQKELVFFRKSNYVIDDYDLLGYGGGCEFELPIKGDSIYYHFSYSWLKPYSLNSFLSALKDYELLKQKTKENSQPISKNEQTIFSSKSELHKLFLECKNSNYDTKIEIPKDKYLINLEKNYIYQDYENKIFVLGYNIDSIVLKVDDAEVWKKENYFIVKPQNAYAYRWINVFLIKDKNQSKPIYNQIFEVIELPEPRIYFGEYYSDTLNDKGYSALPRVAHYLDYMHKDENLKYELLNFTLTIKSEKSSKEFNIKSSKGTPELIEILSITKPNDQIIISDVYVLYPNKTVKQIKGRSVLVGKRN